ncbi:hypothetical protein BTA51_04840 [Hahella sp. CCB-MM4]|uniref:substrate-binding periplasmic protein n=1 Tax=Hahella sp. (strain CCB-MM4) TaxID=1926491 RepID=UPI000B9C2C07|nr:transporter substrate-binding domain-containing protein [Hahella sp. CCB-MM4]OZG74342.1 hypothetical protein BTA51_04840 [Hahella sp. CCB-MM4]
MARFLKTIVFLLAGILTSRSLVYAEEFRVLGHLKDLPPYFFTQGDALTGFYKDFFEAISEITGDRFIFHQHPITRGLVLFEQNQVDIEPGVNPVWRIGQKTHGLYSIPYAKSIDIVLFGSGKSFPVAKPFDLRGKRIGVVRGYQYPGFTELFLSGEIERYDLTGESQLLEMLVLGRLDQVIINKDMALYRMQQDPAYQKLEVGYQVSSVNVMLRIHPNKKEALPRLNAAIKQLIDHGRIEQIWNKYR